MSDIVYRVRSDSIAHAYTKYSVLARPTSASQRNERTSVTNVNSLRKKARANNGTYKSPYYDPVARHERYMRERESLGIGKGKVGLGSSKSGKGSKGSGGSKGGKGSGGSKGTKGGKGSGGTKMAEEIRKLREESSLNTEAQREATKRRIEDLRNEIQSYVKSFGKQSEDQAEGVNSVEIKGRVEQLKKQIEQAGVDLNSWISNEKDALERRIAAIYSANGKEYKVHTQADKKSASEARDKEVKSRADSIYKKKS